jgi:hypothetical protein
MFTIDWSFSTSSGLGCASIEEPVTDEVQDSANANCEVGALYCVSTWEGPP